MFRKPTILRELSDDGDNLPDHLGIVRMLKVLGTMSLLGKGIDGETSVRDAAAPTQIHAVTLQDDI